MHLYASSATSYTTMNVLFLVADDMRPDLGCYEDRQVPFMHTPNLDALASRSLLLKNAHVQEAICGPSRTSFLTGRRPDTTHVYDLEVYFRDVGNFTTLPEYFKQNGYITAGFGKIFHPGYSSNFDDPPSWTEPYYHAPTEDLWYYDLIMNENGTASWLGVPETVREKLPLPDDLVTENVINFLDNIPGDQPFFAAVGFDKPHLPFIFPADFIKYYPSEDVDLPTNPFAPVEMPTIAWNNYCTNTIICSFTDTFYSNATGEINSTMDLVVVRNLRRAYYASISYVDSLVGKIVNKLDELGISDNTIISFLGDHGWQLGEHGAWCKQTNFELATHAPLMVRVPGKTDQGIVAEKLTEMVDLYPTIIEAAGLPSPPLCPEINATNVKFCREGTSLMALIDNPDAPWKMAVFSQYPRIAANGASVMGYTIRTDQYRYTEWVKFRGDPDYVPIWSVPYGIELYDHSTDPDENINRANFTTHEEIRAVLSTLLHNGWRQIPVE